MANRYPRHAGLFHFLGEVEVIFGVWVLILLVVFAVLAGPSQVLTYTESRAFAEPLFVPAVMVIAASRPILERVTGVVQYAARLLPVKTNAVII
ncbi:protein of unknown function DUF1504 [Burkholderia ambifaria MEX-5]|uniref:Uncharacterized protein n=1 Tax=Burkholderia ambifaria MEX-5 TaxID=396597 RepID=B1T0Q9_9BURK|nr:protein of unknown function DUF1504 [Burkholderia ambifaria MEX-5]